MNIYNILAVSLTVILYIRLHILLRKEIAEQNLATWMGWVLLDAMAGASIYSVGGNWYILLIYVVGGSTICWSIYGTAEFTWGKIEIICFSLVVACIIVWQVWEPQYATVISTIGMCIATWPQLKDAFLTPKAMPMDVYSGFIGVNVLATIAGKSWTLEERLYPAVCTVLCVLIVGCISQKYFEVKRPRGA